MKKLLALLLALAMVFSLMTVLTACGDDEDDDDKTSDEDKDDDDKDDDKDDDDDQVDEPAIRDTNRYYLIGTGSGDLCDCEWTHEVDGLYLGEVSNCRFTLIVELHEGDQFQICHGGSWDGQMGIGCVKGWEYADGINPITGVECTAADKYYVEVTGDDGTVYFCGGAEWDNSPTQWNIIVVEEGFYKIILTTDPSDPSNNLIEFEYMG